MIRKAFIQILSSKWLQHPLFWVLSLYAIGDYFAISNTIQSIDFFYSGLFHIPLFFLVYVNLGLMVPKLLQKRRFILYLLSVPALVFATYGLHELTFEILLPALPTEYYMVSFTDWEVLVTIFVIYFVFTTLLKLSKSWYLLQKVEKEKLAIELNSLKTQVNPHFLFNSLNSIYSLSLAKSEQTPETVLELSNLLRYMLYEVGDDTVDLGKELEMMESYVELQKLRADESTEVTFKVTGEPSGIKAAPLLFFPLIENSFKHGVKGVSDQAYVHILLAAGEEAIHFEIENNKGQVDDVEQGQFGGIGLENVKRRLSLIYPGKHSFQIVEDEQVYKVELKIEL